MEKTLKDELLTNIGLVYNLAKNCKLENLIFEVANKELSFLSDYFKVSNSQALFISVIFSLNFKGQKVDIDDLNTFFDCNPMQLLSYIEDFDELYTRRILCKNSKIRRTRNLILSHLEEVFYINQIVSDKILKSEPMPDVLIDTQKFNNIFSLIEKVYEIGKYRDENSITTKQLFEQFEGILKENLHFPLIEKSQYLGVSREEKYLFFYVIWKFLEGDKDTWIHRAFQGIYDQTHERITETQRFLAKETSLIKEDWLEIEDADFFDDAKMKLSDKAIDLLAECDIKLNSKKTDKAKNIIQPNDVPFRKLIYSDDEVQQLELLKSLLNEDNFKNTQDRLEQKALPKGITALLHGGPGTGKTESVLQIAKATNREIIKVDISESRSMWFGESEKIIKQVFKDYKSYAKKQKSTPILFFNEADAIISKRKDVANSNVSDTENRIQNILLEEIENFEGILIATTNLADNLDKAFERRFLFKIEFQKPSISTKTQIWQLKMQHLSNEDCAMLASRFDFSGGQIDNIVRKNEINEIIHGSTLDINTLLEYCKEETLSNQNNKTTIGFK